ncbi:MAG: hypothetical protein ACUVX8_06480 [Candidatus Zipacnadales bacterium]
MDTVLGRRRLRAVAAGVASTLVLVSPVFAERNETVRQVGSLLFIPTLLLAAGMFQGVLAALLPRWTVATQTAVEERRGLCLLWGFSISLFVLLITLALSAVAQPLGAVGLFFALVVGLMSVAGYVGIAAALGTKLLSYSNGVERLPLQALVGGIVLCYSCLVPVIGQILAALVLCTAIGAAAVALFCKPLSSLPTARMPTPDED